MPKHVTLLRPGEPKPKGDIYSSDGICSIIFILVGILLFALLPYSNNNTVQPGEQFPFLYAFLGTFFIVYGLSYCCITITRPRPRLSELFEMQNQNQ